MSIKVKPTIKRINDEIDEPITCPEAMNDPENLAMRQNITEKKFVKDYDTIKAKLDEIDFQYSELMCTLNFDDETDVKLCRLETIINTLGWVLRNDNSDL